MDHRVWGRGPVTALLAITACGGGMTSSGRDVVRLDPAACALTGSFSLESTHPYFPLEVGRRWTLAGGDERVEITVLDETEVVGGVTARVVEEREWEDDELVEVSRNFMAQASDGTICYFGEDVEDYEDGEVVSRGGEWRADAPGSRPGILMPAEPRTGLRFVMEAAPGEAEDEGEIVAVGETIEVPAGTFRETVRIREFNPLEDEAGDKLYARGVGMIVDEDLELVSQGRAGDSGR